MRRLPLEGLRLRQAAAGTPAIDLTRQVGTDEFAGYARGILAMLEGTLETRVDSPFEHVWEVRIRQKPFWLAWDETGVSLQPRDEEASALVPALHERLLRYRERGT